MKQKRNSKSKSTGNKTQPNNNYGGYSNESKAFPSKSKSHGAKDQIHYPGNSVTHNSNQNVWGRSRNSSVSDMWSDADEHFPVLGAVAPEPKVNVWEERKSKQEAIKAMQPENAYDEEAMLQHALAMSLLEATQEEEIRKKMEEDYKMQLEALQYFPEDVEDFDASNDFKAEENSQFKDFPLREQLESCSRNSASNNSQNETIYNSKGSKHEDEFFVKEQPHLALTKSSSTFSSNNSVSNYSQKEKSYSSAGARPKINKAIEAFGGWGLKEDKKRSNSDKISEFVDDVLYEKSSKSDNYNKISKDNKNKSKVVTKENSNFSKDDILHSTDTKNVAKSNDKSDVLYDEKGAFLNDDDDDTWYGCNIVNRTCVSPNKVLDTWLNSEDVSKWNNECINESIVPTLNDKNNEDLTHASSFSDTPKLEVNDDKNLSSSTEFPISTITSDYESKVINSECLFQENSESSKSIWSTVTNFEEQGSSESKSVHNYNTCDSNTNSFTPFHEPTEVPTLMSGKVWSEKSSNNSAYFSSFSDNLSSNLESVKLGENADNEVFSATSLSNDSDIPPIPPPQTPPLSSSINEYTTSATGNNDSSIESSPIPQPQPAPEMTGLQLPTFGNPILNPMFLGLNPMLGYGMDPLLMRRMLILTNPFLANQLLAMEQYYRSLGMPVDLFSMPSSMSNASELMNPSFLQNTVINNVNINMQQLECQIQQLQTQIDANALTNENPIESLEQKSYEPPEIDTVNNCDDTSVSVKTCDDDQWYKSYLSDDNAVIPPPKPPSNEVNCNNLVSVSQNSELSQNVSNNENKFDYSHISNNSTGHLSNMNKEKPARVFDASSTKTEITGWGDLEDDFPDAQSFKSQTWDNGWADDGWGDDIPPPKPARNLSIHDDKKKTVFRQPAKQPQISRYQRNFT